MKRERLLGRALITRTQFLEAVDRIQGMGPESVILSLGSRGAIGSGPEGVFEALPPRIDALCPIGAGDAMAAAFVWSMEKKKSFAGLAALGSRRRHRQGHAPGHDVPDARPDARGLQTGRSPPSAVDASARTRSITVAPQRVEDQRAADARGSESTAEPRP